MSPASLAWLDYSESDRRRAREIVQMFSQRESRDELGLGGIRDALSNTLFPGTSVLLTRARYFLFIPWLYREGGRHGYRGPRLTSWVQGRERQLIDALRKGRDHRGLIGIFAGAAIQTLPSGIYWNSLQQFGILRHDGTEAQVADFRQNSRLQEDATELLERSDAVWSPSMPGHPKGFFKFNHCDFALTVDESSWLAERIAEAVPGTLLQFLTSMGRRPSATAQFVWEDPTAVGASGPAGDALDEARRFAVTMHGAALLYNVLLAERAEELGLTKFDGHRDSFAIEMENWRRDAKEMDIGGWDIEELWALLTEQGRPPALHTKAFVTSWVELIRSRLGNRLSEDPYARALVCERELRQKRSQARLRNDRLMRQWGGSSGAGRLDFRWPNIKTLLNDIVDGRENGRARP